MRRTTTSSLTESTVPRRPPVVVTLSEGLMLDSICCPGLLLFLVGRDHEEVHCADDQHGQCEAADAAAEETGL